MINNDDVKVVSFFEGLGYDMDWDFRGSEVWHEILWNGRMVCQIDCGVPLNTILEDLMHIKNGTTNPNPFDYKINLPDTPITTEFLEKVAENM